jgi:hypothetical protein
VRPCPAWKRPPPVTFIRYGTERDSFPLVDCEGTVTAEAIDRLSVVARPPWAPRPELPLPLEPLVEGSDEWLPQVKLVHPRLVWALWKVAQAFPRRAIYVVSGYRRDGHSSLHKLGRAADVFVMGIDNTNLIAFCRTLNDVGCGYYPHHNFIHIDVRPYGTPETVWVDASQPGQPSLYVDGWPGVVEPGISVEVDRG